jgi:tRNA A37 threonylcarbamoyladenosine synthetase subunit TsaC/SUA5/YrdC
MLYPARLVSAEPSLFSVGATQESVAVPVPGIPVAVTVMLNAGSEALAVPSATVITIPEVVPASLTAGVPDNWPVLVLKVAQAGACAIEKVSAPPSEALALGVKL